MFSEITIDKKKTVYVQLKEYIRQMIIKGILKSGQKLPSTRELADILSISRNTAITAYKCLEDEGFIYTEKAKGAFVQNISITCTEAFKLAWKGRITEQARLAEELDLMKHGVSWEKGMISFTSIAPDEKLFNANEFKRAFLDRFSVEGEKLLNYGYARGYKPLVQYLMKYMEGKGVDVEGKDLIIVNGFTEGFDLMLTALCSGRGRIICENPTHNTAIKIMKLHGLDIAGVDMEDDGINLTQLKEKLSGGKADLIYTIPSYHNPTGIVTSPEKRVELIKISKEYEVPVIEDGFNEELRYSGSHITPLISCCGKGNSVVYVGSFSKVLFPGIRTGWIFGDIELINYIESLKRSRNIHTSTIDQAVLFQYFLEGNFGRYIKKAKRVYKHKFELAKACAEEYITYKKALGVGGLHIFLELEQRIDAREVLARCYEKGVVFTPGDIFYTDNKGANTLRLGFSRVEDDEIRKGFKIIGEVVAEL
ncbi:MAG: PLP-dependent aminotransferase family protein [Clostridia bacterium]|nr:PLP-dependent aminotransferase family protein [Clostridia bacterium]